MILQITIHNFKSYKNTTSIGPLSKLSCIIGPNGSGKSNIIDAIIFALGINTNLRSNNLNDLKYNQNAVSFVTLVIKNDFNGNNKENNNENEANNNEVNSNENNFNNKENNFNNKENNFYSKDKDFNNKENNFYSKDKEFNSDIKTDFMNKNDNTNSTFLLKREITVDGRSKYFINNSQVSFVAYQNFLLNRNIHIKAKNFIVFQDDVNAISLKSPKQLSEFIEHISGSIFLKEEYDQALADYNNASHRCMNAYELKKENLHKIRENERSEEKKAEIQNIIRKQGKINTLITLCKIRDKATQIANIENEIEAHEIEIENVSKAINAHEMAIKDDELQFALHQKEIIQIQRAVYENNEKMNGLKMMILREEERDRENKINSDKLKNKISEIEMEIKRLESENEGHKSEISSIQRAFNEFLDAHINEINDYNLIKDQLEQAEEDFRRNYKDEILEVDKIKRDIFKIENTNEFMQNKRKEIEAEIRKLEKKKNTLYALKTQKIGNFVTIKRELEDFKKTNLHKIEQYKILLDAENAKNEELTRITAELINIKEIRREIDRKMNIKRVVEHLKSIFTGVCGRFVDLIEPTQKKYEIPLSVLLGSYDQAVVVDNEETAIKVIDYMKRNKYLRLSFLPLANLRNFKILTDEEIMKRVGNINEFSEVDYSHNGEREGRHYSNDYNNTVNTNSNNNIQFTLTTKTIIFDTKYSNAINMILGNTIIVNNSNTAKQILFKKGIKANIATLDGIYFHKSGSITGGSYKNKFDSENSIKLIERRNRIFKELRLIQNQKQEFVNVEILNEKIEFLTDKVAKAGMEIEEIDIRKIENEIFGLKNYLAGLEENNAFKDDLSVNSEGYERKNEPPLLKIKKFNHLENVFFNQILKNTGFSDYQKIKEFRKLNIEERQLEMNLLVEKIENKIKITESEMEMKNDERAKLINQLHKLGINVKCINSNFDDDVKINTNNDSNKNTENDLNIKMLTNPNGNPLVIRYNEFKEKSILLTQQLNALESVLLKIKINLKDKNLNLNNIIQKNNKLIQEKINLISTINQLREEKEEIIKYSKMENIELPVISRSNQENANASIGFSHDLIDFSCIKDTLENYSKQLSDLNLKLNSLIPFINSNESVDYSKYESQYEELKEEVKVKKKAFVEVKERRMSIFMDCFDFVSRHINYIYRDLNCGNHLNEDNISLNEHKENNSSEYAHRGRISNDLDPENLSDNRINNCSASLILENSATPFEGGVKFYVMPPNKKYREMRHLSGGEKTIASLSLIFAVHKYRPSPFYIFDEIDSALDKFNVKKLIFYLMKSDVQSVVVSLKPDFFQYAEMLVGVYKKDGFSRVLGYRVD